MSTKPERRVFRQSLTVLAKQRSFGGLETGQCFTVPGDAGFGEIWIGFPVYIKVNQEESLDLEDGRQRAFCSDTMVLLVRYGSIEKPQPDLDRAQIGLHSDSSNDDGQKGCIKF